MSISSTIKSIQDIMRRDVGVDGDAQRIGQLVWMLFLKIFDDREAEWESNDSNYHSPIPAECRWRAWATDPNGLDGEGLRQFVDDVLFPKLQKLNEANASPAASVVQGVFEDARNYMKSGQLIREVVNKIQSGVDFKKSQKLHAFGDIYEQLLRDLQSAGNAGEFYTPRPVTEFMVRMVDPKLREKVLDPACGTGGFLTCAIEHKRKLYVHTAKDERDLQISIFGIEKKPLPHLLATTNMVLHGIEVPNQIRRGNTLARELGSWKKEEKVQCIFANPPFGGVEEKGIESNFPQSLRTRETADLFLMLIMHLLEKNGRAAVVLPDGFLFGEGTKTKLKEKLLAECDLHTIVRLPNGVFSPYTSIKTNILFFTKGRQTNKIWFYEHQFPKGVKGYSKTKSMSVSEFSPEEAWWGLEQDGFISRAENKFAWSVDVSDIKARNYNLDCKNPHVNECFGEDPNEILLEYLQLQSEVSALCTKLESALSEALEKDE
ncbi:DNA methyltransferase [Pseudomonas syringae ICMP 11293]|uniref:type I restriction-modification system subunit M n=1 Tax=Pseudomonas syringae TaxID=317 RepID=UPI000731D0C0|nr:class I SAM-dependent DNA methyltransferase [Pseudomonas syringae]KTB89009.1 DNA methyltransferase [Pseudomonas syringae ICMP 11293]